MTLLLLLSLSPLATSSTAACSALPHIYSSRECCTYLDIQTRFNAAYTGHGTAHIQAALSFRAHGTMQAVSIWGLAPCLGLPSITRQSCNRTMALVSWYLCASARLSLTCPLARAQEGDHCRGSAPACNAGCIYLHCAANDGQNAPQLPASGKQNKVLGCQICYMSL